MLDLVEEFRGAAGTARMSLAADAFNGWVFFGGLVQPVGPIVNDARWRERVGENGVAGTEPAMSRRA